MDPAALSGTGEKGTCVVIDPSLSSCHPSHVHTLTQLQMTPELLQQLTNHMTCCQHAQDAFYVVDAAALEARYQLWYRYLPQVRPFYAVKCNPDPFLIEMLARLGTGFDCASKAEIDEVLKHDVGPEDIIYANPCKQPSHLRYATSRGVNVMTFDSIDELTKVQAVNPNAQLVLRLFVDDTKSICRLGTKFGAMVHDVPAILEHAKKLGLTVMGASFHVGSGCLSVSAYSEAVARARKVFDIAESMGFHFELLDIGGGFPGTLVGAHITFEDCAKELQTSLATHFPKSSGIRIISEPGRFFAASTHTLAVNVIGRKVAPSVDPPVSDTSVDQVKTPDQYMYYVNDGLYGSFNCVIFDHPFLQPVVLSKGSNETFKASIWGPTCDGMDCILQEINMPVLEAGDWIVFPGMGAYTCAAGSQFNGFDLPLKFYFDSREPKP